MLMVSRARPCDPSNTARQGGNDFGGCPQRSSRPCGKYRQCVGGGTILQLRGWWSGGGPDRFGRLGPGFTLFVILVTLWHIC